MYANRFLKNVEYKFILGFFKDNWTLLFVPLRLENKHSRIGFFTIENIKKYAMYRIFKRLTIKYVISF